MDSPQPTVEQLARTAQSYLNGAVGGIQSVINDLDDAIHHLKKADQQFILKDNAAAKARSKALTLRRRLAALGMEVGRITKGD